MKINAVIGFVPYKEWTNKRISHLVIDESKTVWDSGFHVVYGFILWQDFSDFVFLGDGIRIPLAKDSWFYKRNLSGFSIMKEKNTDNIEERFVSFWKAYFLKIS